MTHHHLVDVGLDAMLHERSREVLVCDASIVELVAIFFARAELVLRPLIGIESYLIVPSNQNHETTYPICPDFQVTLVTGKE